MCLCMLMSVCMSVCVYVYVVCCRDNNSEHNWSLCKTLATYSEMSFNMSLVFIIRITLYLFNGVKKYLLLLGKSSNVLLNCIFLL